MYSVWVTCPELMNWFIKSIHLCLSLVGLFPPSSPHPLPQVKMLGPMKDSGPLTTYQNSSMLFGERQMLWDKLERGPAPWELLQCPWLLLLPRTCGPSYRRWRWRTQLVASWSMPSIWARPVSSSSSTSQDLLTTRGQLHNVIVTFFIDTSWHFVLINQT